MILGSTFAGSGSAVSYATAKEAAVTSFTLTGMVLDELYATKDSLINFNWNIPSDWTFNTYLHALYQNDVYAGNVSFSESIVQKIKIKKRYKGDFAWKTIYEKEIHSNEDFAIEFYDYYSPSGKEIEYAYVAVISGADTDTISTSVYSEFECYFICDRNASYPMILDTSNTVTYNKESQTIISPGCRYPYVVNNGIARYYSGTLTATFIELGQDGYDVENGWSYRNQIDQFLSDGKPKILKSFEGDMYMVNVVGSLPRAENGHYQNISHSIEWMECGDPTRIADLYDKGFIDTDIDRE